MKYVYPRPAARAIKVTMFTTAVSVRNVNVATPRKHSKTYDSSGEESRNLKRIYDVKRIATGISLILG